MAHTHACAVSACVCACVCTQLAVCKSVSQLVKQQGVRGGVRGVAQSFSRLCNARDLLSFCQLNFRKSAASGRQLSSVQLIGDLRSIRTRTWIDVYLSGFMHEPLSHYPLPPSTHTNTPWRPKADLIPGLRLQKQTQNRTLEIIRKMEMEMKKHFAGSKL